MSFAYITRTSKHLPGKQIGNEEMEEYLGEINGQPSRTKQIILRQNKIVGRYYALDKGGQETTTNTKMTALAAKELLNHSSGVGLLACGTSTADQLIPAHSVMVHGELPELGSIESISTSGVCCAGMHALKYANNAIRSGDHTSAIVTASERISTALRNWQYEVEAKRLDELEENELIAFEKEFLRWMLSDGASALLVENKPKEDELSLRIDWIDSVSFADKQEVCMYMGGEKQEDGTLKSFFDIHPEDLLAQSTMSVKQDAKLLGEHVIKLGVDHLENSIGKHNVEIDSVDYFLPHISSFYFESKLANEMTERNIEIPQEKWFTNLATVGNVGSASMFLILDELFNNGNLKKGQTLLIIVPESARFSYVTAQLTVC